MKRAILGLTVAALMSGGLVGVSAETADAVCPYTGCVPTSTKVTVVNAPVSKGERAKVCIKVNTSGSGEPRGQAKVGVTRNRGGFRWINTKRYNGDRTCFVTPRLNKAGRYTVRGSFFAGARTPFGNSANVTGLSVQKR